MSIESSLRPFWEDFAKIEKKEQATLAKSHIIAANNIEWDYLPEVHCDISQLVIPKTARKNTINSNLMDLLERLENAGRFIRLYSTCTTLKDYRIELLSDKKKKMD